MLLGTVKLRTLGKTAVVAKRMAKVSSLRSAEPALNLPVLFSGSSFMGVQTLEYMDPIGQQIEMLYQWSQSAIVVGEEKLHPEDRV